MKYPTIETVTDFSEHGIPLAEHWHYLIVDERSCPQMGEELLESSEISKFRKYVIEFVQLLGDRLKQRSLTIQIAINYIDRLLMLGHFETIKSDKNLWVVTSLLLASKYDELDRDIPFIKDFGKISSKAKYSYSEVTKCETKF